jgi:hypothetical protein
LVVINYLGRGERRKSSAARGEVEKRGMKEKEVERNGGGEREGREYNRWSCPSGHSESITYSTFSITEIGTKYSRRW